MAWTKQDLDWQVIDTDDLPAQTKAQWSKVRSTLLAHHAELELLKKALVEGADAPSGQVWRISVQKDRTSNEVLLKMALAEQSVSKVKKSSISFKSIAKRK